MTSPTRPDDALLARATDVLCEAFADYPVMHHVLGTRDAGYDRGLRTLIRFFVTARVLRGEPVLILAGGDDEPAESGPVECASAAEPDDPARREQAGGDGEAAACALVTLPGKRPSPPALGELRERVWAELGPEARARYEAFGEACATLAIEEPHHHLNMIGVRARHRGKGLARRLLDDVHRMARDDPGSAGVTLTTEDPANLPLYRHVGYRCLGSVRVGDDLESWSFFRPRGADEG